MQVHVRDVTEDIKAVCDTVGAREVLRIRSQHIIDELSVVAVVVRYVHHQLIVKRHQRAARPIARIKLHRALSANLKVNKTILFQILK